MTNAKFKRLFCQVQSAAVSLSAIRSVFDAEIKERYGFHYSDKDIDEIIECLDYGFDTMTFEKFKALMQEADNAKS